MRPQTFPTPPKSALSSRMSNTSDTPRTASQTALTTSSITTTEDPGWTPERQAAFLRALSGTHSVTKAARAVGMSRQSAYKLRARLKGEPFDLAWTAALRCRFDALAEAAMERAVNGVEVPHFHNGELIHTSRRFDERLTVALLMMRDQFRPPRAQSYEPASLYGADDFGPLVERVEHGPETWAEQLRAERDALYAECDGEGGGEDAQGDWEEDCEQDWEGEEGD